MKILTLNYEYPPLGGGAAPVSQEITEYYASQGHECEVVTMAFGELPRIEQQNGITIHRVAAIRKKQETCATHEMLSYVVSALPKVSAKLRQENFDIIHVHFAIPTGLLAHLATWFNKVPYVITSHGSDIPGYNPDRFTLEHKITTPLLRMIMGRASMMTAPSQYLCNLIKEVKADVKIKHIPNGIHVDKYDLSRAKKRQILMTGRLLPRKGFQHVLRALVGMDGDFEIHIAGDGPTMEELQNIAKDINQSVTFHGWLDNNSPKLKELYESASIFCLPSERENASISLLEAMLAGTAVITTNVSGCPETVGETGLLVTPCSVDELRHALSKVLHSDDYCALLGLQARRRVLDVFDWNRIGEQYLQIFRDLI